jgi:hypothetical protein
MCNELRHGWCGESGDDRDGGGHADKTVHDPLAKSLSEVTRPKRRHKGGDAQARQEAGPGSVRAVNLEAELAQLGLLPTVEDPIIYRGLGKTGFGLFLHLETGLDLQTLGRLADSRDRAALLRRISAQD